MKILIIILILTIVGLTVALVRLILQSSRADDILDTKYRNEDGYHLYYDKSIIEKKEFKRRFPDKTLRKFPHLFSKR